MTADPASALDVAVLIASTDPDLRAAARTILAGAVRGLHEAEDGREALLASARQPPDLVVADLDLPGLDGAALARAVRASLPGVLVVLLLDPDHPASLRRAAAAPFARWLPRPPAPEALFAAVVELAQEALRRRRLEEEGRLVEAMLMSLPNPAMLLDRAGRTALAVNQAALDLGLRPGQPCAGPFFAGRLLAGTPDASAFADCLAYYAPRREEIRAHGRVWDASLVPVAGGRLLFSATDVTARQAAEETLRHGQAELERRVAARTEELRLMNEELSREVGLRRRVEAELIRAKEAAEAASRAKGAFVAHMSHELRTPMNAILGFIDLALDTPLTEELRQYLSLTKISAQALLGVLNDVLDFSKIEAGRLDLQSLPFSPRQVVADAVQMFQPQAQAKGIALRWSVRPDVPGTILGDATRFKQIIVNLLGNAVKFTESGEIALSLQPNPPAGPAPDGGALLRLSVRDTGPGVPPDQLAAIFDSFAQADEDLARKRCGAGLGLAICRRLAELMGGRIWAESVLGQGSTFHFTVRCPRPSLSQERSPDRAAAVAAGLRVLLVDDHDISRLMTASILRRAGCAPTEAASGQEALACLAREPFDCVLMDVRMPDMDGLEAVRRIRDGEVSPARRDTPVVAVTAYALKGDRERFLAAGMDGYLSKPFDAAQLLGALSQALAGGSGREGEADGRDGPVGMEIASGGQGDGSSPSPWTLSPPGA